MKIILTAVAAAIAIPAAAYAQVPAPTTARPATNMADHSECMKMHAMMMSMMHGSGAQGGQPMMNGGNGQAHQQMMTPGANAPAAAQHQQHQ